MLGSSCSKILWNWFFEHASISKRNCLTFRWNHCKLLHKFHGDTTYFIIRLPHARLFRNELGKWITLNPLFSPPDFSRVASCIIIHISWKPLDCVFLLPKMEFDGLMRFVDFWSSLVSKNVMSKERDYATKYWCNYLTTNYAMLKHKRNGNYTMFTNIWLLKAYIMCRSQNLRLTGKN